MGEKFRWGLPSGWRLPSARRQGRAADPEANLTAGPEKATATAVLVADPAEPEPPAAPGRFGWLRRLPMPSRGWRSWAPVAGKAVAGAGITAVVGIVAVVLGLYGLPELASLRSGGDLSSPSGTALPTGFPPVPAPSLPAAGGLSPGPGATPGPIFATPRPGPSTGAAVQPGGRPSDALAPWAANLSRLGIPQVALQAYAYAELVIGRTQPSCKLSWTLLAGIGSVESNHGRHGGAKLQPDGTSIPKIVGIPLDGTTTERIPDTDGGAIDGNPTYDQAVGAMQFIPSTWKTWGADADGNGVADPFNINDAALTAGYYLCANNRDLSTADGWWSAVLSYNHVTRYAMNVYTATDRYGHESLQP